MKNVFFPFLLLLSLSAFTQSFDQKFGKVSMAEMEMKVCPIDSSAAAVMLFDKGETKMVYNDNFKSFQLEFSRHFRIKILKKEGLEYGNFEISLYKSGSDEEKLTRLKGVTYFLNNGKIDKFKIEKENKFKENKSENNIEMKVAFPKVEEGSVLECEYTIVSDFIFNFQPWSFQKKIPVLFSAYDTYTIDYYSYNNNISGYEKVKVENSEPLNKSFVYTWSESAQGGVINKYSHTYEYTEIKKTYTAQNLPGIKNETFVDDIDNYISRIDFELSSVRMPDQPIKNYSSTWESVTNKLIESDNFGKQLNGGAYMKEELIKVIEGIEKPEDKISKIRSFIFSKIKWDEKYGIYTEKGVKSAFKEGFGNIADINLNLVIALKQAGLDAFPLVLSTRSHGRVFDWNKQSSDFNYVVAGIKINDKYVLSDAVSEITFLGMLPIECLNGQARIIDPVKSVWVDLNPKTSSKKNGFASYSIDRDAKVKGKVSTIYKDYFAQQLKESIKGDDSLKHKKENISKLYNNSSIDSLKIIFSDNNLPEIKESYYIDNNETATSVGDLIYLIPCQGFGIGTSPFVKVERKFPVNFTFPREEAYIIRILIPEGFKVDEQPSNINFSLPEGNGKYFYSCQLVGNELVVISKLVIPKIEYSSIEYPSLRVFIDEVIKKQNEKIVLKKI